MFDIEQLPSAWKGHRTFANWLTKKLNPSVTVDLGVDYGYSLFSLAESSPGTVYGIDSFEGDAHAGFHEDAYDVVKNVIRENNISNIVLIKDYFENAAKYWNHKIDILHIDGLHTYEAAKNDFQTWTPFLRDNNSVVIMHDTVSFEGVRAVYEEANMYKTMFLHSAGLGVLSHNKEFIDLVNETFK